MTELGFADALVRLSHLVQHTFADASRRHELTPQQAQLLCLLIDGPVGMSELGRALHLEKSSLSGLVDRVERRGLLRRVAGERDRRVYLIELSDEGARLGRAVHDDVVKSLEELASGVRPAARAALRSSVTELLAVAGGALLRG